MGSTVTARVAAVLLAGLALSGCGDDPPGQPSPAPTSAPASSPTSTGSPGAADGTATSQADGDALCGRVTDEDLTSWSGARRVLNEASVDDDGDVECTTRAAAGANLFSLDWSFERSYGDYASDLEAVKPLTGKKFTATLAAGTEVSGWRFEQSGARAVTLVAPHGAGRALIVRLVNPTDLGEVDFDKLIAIATEVAGAYDSAT